MQILNDDEIVNTPYANELIGSGTLVLWEKLDRLSDETQKTSLKDHLYEQLDRARHHLELVFHRFLNGEKPFTKLAIKINGTAIEAYDPFNSDHPATIRQPKKDYSCSGSSGFSSVVRATAS